MKDYTLQSAARVPFKRTFVALLCSVLITGCGGGSESSEAAQGETSAEQSSSENTDSQSGSQANNQTDNQTDNQSGSQGSDQADSSENEKLSPEEGYKKLAESILDNAILPSYQTMHTQAQALKKSVDSFCSLQAPAQSDLALLQTSWKQTNEAWQVARTIKFGPLSEEYNFSRIQIWPIDSTKISSAVENALASNEDFATDFYLQKHQLQGLPAMEYVIFNQGESTQLISSENRTERCEYLSAVGDNVQLIMADVIQKWQGDYGAGFKEGSGSFTSHTQALEKFLTTWFEYLEVIRDDKLDALLHSEAPGKPEFAESAFAETSFNNIKINIQTLEQQLKGYEGFGFDDYLTQVSDRDEVYSEITLHFEAIYSALDVLANKPMKALLANESSRTQLKALSNAINELRELMGTDFVQVTDLAPGFNTNDGD